MIMDKKQYDRNLRVPDRCVDVILDTDAYNEVDDQFALAYLLLSPERMHPVGICAAPFLNNKSTSPADGMEKSRREILKVLGLMGREELAASVYAGSAAFLKDEHTPVESPAAELMASMAEHYSPQEPLYIVAIGAITNVASAILKNRTAMCENTVVVWLGGHALHWERTDEFNMVQDIAAARVVMGSGVPLVQLPCNGVVSELRTTEHELLHYLGSSNPLGEYLCENVMREMAKVQGTAWSRIVWDVAAVAWLLNDGDRFMKSRIIPAPLPDYDSVYSLSGDRHSIAYVHQLRRDQIFTDLFARIRRMQKGDHA